MPSGCTIMVDNLRGCRSEVHGQRYMLKKQRLEKLTYVRERIDNEVAVHLKDKTFRAMGIHPIYILSKGEWGSVEKNSIILKHYHRETCVKKPKLEGVEVTSFKVSAVGSNVKRAFKGHTKKNPIRLCEITKNFIEIVINKEEIASEKKIKFIDTADHSSSGKALLLLSGSRASIPLPTSCNKDIVGEFKTSRYDIIKKGGSHFGSMGESYGVGCAPKMGNVGGLSVGEFCAPVDVNLHSGMFNVMREWVGVGAQIPDRIIPKVMSHITVCNKKISETIQERYGEGDGTKFVTNILLGYGKHMGDFISSHLCQNCFTKITHTECDCCFTLLYVPPQPNKPNKSALLHSH